MSEVKASDVKSSVMMDTALLTVRTARRPTNALVVGDMDLATPVPNTIELDGNDYILLYVTIDLDAGSGVTEIRLRLTSGPGGGDFYDYVEYDPQAMAASPIDAANAIDNDIVLRDYVIPVAAGAVTKKILEIPINDAELQVAAWADALGHVDDLFGITARRVIRDSLVKA